MTDEEHSKKLNTTVEKITEILRGETVHFSELVIEVLERHISKTKAFAIIG